MFLICFAAQFMPRRSLEPEFFQYVVASASRCRITLAFVDGNLPTGLFQRRSTRRAYTGWFGVNLGQVAACSQAGPASWYFQPVTHPASCPCAGVHTSPAPQVLQRQKPLAQAAECAGLVQVGPHARLQRCADLAALPAAASGARRGAACTLRWPLCRRRCPTQCRPPTRPPWARSLRTAAPCAVARTPSHPATASRSSTSRLLRTRCGTALRPAPFSGSPCPRSSQQPRALQPAH